MVNPESILYTLNTKNIQNDDFKRMSKTDIHILKKDIFYNISNTKLFYNFTTTVKPIFNKELWTHTNTKKSSLNTATH